MLQNLQKRDFCSPKASRSNINFNTKLNFDSIQGINKQFVMFVKLDTCR